MQRILIIKIGALGDVLRTTCILPGLKQKFPGCTISWLTATAAIPLLVNNPLVDELLLREHLDNNRPVIPLAYDLAINLDDDEWACDLASGLDVRKLFGAYTSGSTRNYTPDSAMWFDMSLISRFGKSRADQLKKTNSRTYPNLLFDMLSISSAPPSLSIPQEKHDQAKRFARHHLNAGSPVIGLNSGAGSRWRFKQLGEKKTAELTDHLRNEFGPNILLFGGTSEAQRNCRIRNLTNFPIVDTGHNHTLLEFAALIGLCDVLISSDSLALHIATSLEIPVVGFFGPTSPSEIALFGGGEKIVPDMKCTCCYLPDCNIRPTCMDRITIEQISAAVGLCINKPD